MSKELEALEKIGQLEDIEDGLGIDLITLFKVFKKEHIIVKDRSTPYLQAMYDTGEYIFQEVNTNYLVLNIKEKALQLYMENNIVDENYYFKDYGKTWALTKEELE